MSRATALLTFSIGPVHSFIAQARRVADVWAGSSLLSHLMETAVSALRQHGGDTVFPVVDEALAASGIPNRVVCRVPLDGADEVGRAMEEAVLAEWDGLVEAAVRVLRGYDLEPAAHLWSPSASRGERQTDHVFDVAWSWLPEDEGYAPAARAGAQRYAASRTFRPFEQVEESDEKCALCGVRTALPNGDRERVRSTWQAAEEAAEGTGDQPFFRLDQGRLCLVCATKRLYTHRGKRRALFFALDAFHTAQAREDRERPPDNPPYVALVACDGDRMGQVLAWGDGRVRGEVEDFHRALSDALSNFARSLRSTDRNNLTHLNLQTLDLTSRAAQPPQLIYAGGDDVLVVCAPEDALPVARALDRHYRRTLAEVSDFLSRRDLERLTLSSAVLYGHGRYPAGLLFREVGRLLHETAKEEAGRDALAIRLEKRSGKPVEVAFEWSHGPDPESELTWPEALDALVEQIREAELSSTQTFNLRQEETVLAEVFEPEDWGPWLTDRLSRSERSTPDASGLAESIAPFFVHDKAPALRIARFLGREVER